MRIARLLILLALVLLAALAAVYLVFTRGGGGAAEATPAPEAPAGESQVSMGTVVVAAQPIRRGQQITQEMVTSIEVPITSIVQGQITDLQQALGKLAARDLPQGIFLTEGDLVSTAAELPSQGSSAALQIPPGFVAISIPITRLTAVSYAVQPGDHVAVLATFPIIDVDLEFQARLPNAAVTLLSGAAQEGVQYLTPQFQLSGAALGRYFEDPNTGLAFYAVPSEPQRPRLVTQMLIPDAVVLYVGTFPLQQEEAQPTPTPAPGEEPQVAQPQPVPAQPQEVRPPDVITLVVAPQDAVTLKYLMDRQIVLTLALRAANDAATLQTESVTLSYILDRYNIVIPAKLPYDVEPRIDRVEMPVLPNDVTPTPVP